MDVGERRVSNVLGDGIGCVELADVMGSEAAIVNRARICYLSHERSTPDGDMRLLRQLIVSDLIHGTPLRVMQFTFQVKLPLFVMRQWTRHIIANHYDVLEFSSLGHHTFDWGGSFDEMSGRYVDFRKSAEYYDPLKLRGLQVQQAAVWQSAQRKMVDEYEALRIAGVPKELARAFMPQSVYTWMNWTVNLQGAMTWYEHRMKGSGAQLEHVKYAEAVLALVGQVAPNVVNFIHEKYGASQ